jgi:predicted ATPase
MKRWRRQAPESRRALPGRQLERELFGEALAAAIAGSPRLLLFEGEGGSGKSSLLAEIASSPLLPRRRIRVALVALRNDDPLDAVAHAAHAFTSHAVFKRVGGRRNFLAMLIRLAPDWIGALPGPGDLLEAIVRTADAIRRRRRREKPKEQIEEELLEILRVARRRAVAMIFDNLELADEAAVERLRRLLRHADVGSRLLVIGAFRTPPPGAPRPPIRLLADRLPRERVSHRRLGPLAMEDLDEWLAQRLTGATVPVAFRDWLLSETGGQPGAVESTLTALLESGVIRPSAGDWEIDTPADVLHAAEALGPELDLSRLGSDVAETVRAASVIGDHFDGDVLARILGLDELIVEDRLAAAARFGLVEVVGTTDRPNGEIATSYRFSSSAARAALLRTVPRARKVILQLALDGKPVGIDSSVGRDDSENAIVPLTPDGP